MISGSCLRSLRGGGSKRTLIRCWARWGSGLLAVRVLQVCDGQIVCQRCR